MEMYKNDKDTLMVLCHDDQTKLDLYKRLAYSPIIVVGPSGVGKSTLINHLKLKYPEAFRFSVSYTTRKARPGEVHGINYFFVSEAEFQSMIESDDFIEYCSVHNNMYGTAKS